MKHFILSTFAFVFFMLGANQLSAQNEYEIRVVHQGGGLLGVEARFVGPGIPPTTSDAFLDFTIDLRWPAAAGLNLMPPTNTGGYGISKAGGETVDGGDEYQGYQLLSAPTFFPVDWVINEWVEIFTVQSSSDGTTGETIIIGALGSNPFNSNIPNFNVSGPDYTPVIAGSASLPVELSAFEVSKYEETSAQLRWNTASELSASHFTIQRSTNAQKWTDLGSVSAVGTAFSEKKYTYLDQDIPVNIRKVGEVYYRLKMVDLNGSYDYSPVRHVRFEVEKVEVNLFPNPTIDWLQISSSENISNIQIYNSAHQIILDREYEEDGVLVGDFPTGVYTIKITTPTGDILKTFVKMD